MLFISLVGAALLSGTIDSYQPQTLSAAIQPYVDSHSLAGAVMLVANRERVLDVSCVGSADIAANKPMKPNDLFWIASEGKPICATALMMLVDEGKLQLDDPVEKYLPEFKNLVVKVGEKDGQPVLQPPSHPTTIREILSHTSGMRFSSPAEHPTFDLMPLRDAVATYAQTPLDSEPGTKYSYANAGINTAGRIVEVLSGKSYEQFLQERLFRPLGMKETTFRPSAAQVERLAKSYKPDAAKTNLVETPISQLKYPLDGPGRYPFPAGGLFSTAQDLSHFCQMILNGGVYHGKRLVSESSVHEMTTKQTPPGVDANYGLGWSVGDTFGHGGAYSTNLTIDPKHDLILIWMVQQEGYANDGDKSLGTFHHVATEQFGSK